MLQNNEKQRLLLNVYDDFISLGGKYINLNKEICTTIYINNFHLFKMQLDQEIENTATAFIMLKNLEVSILKAYIYSTRDNRNWQILIKPLPQ